MKSSTKALDLDAVKAFVFIADLQSFTRAAQTLATTQSALSLKLRRLEEQLGRRLLERTPRQVRLSAEGSLFLQAAVQGQSLFASSGDDGAYDANNANSAPYPSYTKTLSVDAPAASAWITAAGGTTLPGDQTYLHGTYTVKIPAERIWGWDYLVPVCALINLDPVACGIFPAGAGGGVSSYVPMPFYQYFVSGTKTTEAGQTLIDETTTPPTTIVAPAVAS